MKFQEFLCWLEGFEHSFSEIRGKKYPGNPEQWEIIRAKLAEVKMGLEPPRLTPEAEKAIKETLSPKNWKLSDFVVRDKCDAYDFHNASEKAVLVRPFPNGADIINGDYPPKSIKA